MPEERVMNIVLVGRTWNGKSSCGNSILDKAVFQRFGLNGANNSEDQASSQLGEVCGELVRVVDATGLGDCSEDLIAFGINVNNTLKYLMTCTGLHERGGVWGVLVLVLKWGSRFTGQEKSAVQVIKRIFGQNCLKELGIIVMTCGDIFYRENTDFNHWCLNQEGVFKSIFSECEGRCILFNNVTTDSDAKHRQRNQFWSLVKDIQNRGNCILKLDPVAMSLYKVKEGLRSSNEELGREVNNTNPPGMRDFPTEQNVEESAHQLGRAARYFIYHDNTMFLRHTLILMFLCVVAIVIVYVLCFVLIKVQ